MHPHLPRHGAQSALTAVISDFDSSQKPCKHIQKIVAKEGALEKTELLQLATEKAVENASSDTF